MLSICDSLPKPMAAEQAWNADRLNKLKQHCLPGEKERFGRLLLTWHEVKPDGIRLTHDYAACVDTYYWQLYLDCRPRKIFAKCLGQLILRPFHALVKTIYHLSMIPVFWEVHKTLQKEQSWSICFRNSICSVADIVRTPIYALAITITTVAVLIIGTCSPQFMYTGRWWLGKIEQMSNRGETHTLGTLAPCFQPFELEMLDSSKYGRRYSDTDYTSMDEVEIRLENFARKLILHQRNNRNFFNYCLKLDEEIEYVSSILVLVS